MKKHTATGSNDLEGLAEDAKALLAAAPQAVEDKLIEARKSLDAALENGRVAWETAREKALEGAEITDQAIRANPYRALGIAFGVGALLGFLLSRRG